MKSQSKVDALPTKIEIQTVEILLTIEEIHSLLGGHSLSVRHKDTTSSANFYILITKQDVE